MTKSGKRVEFSIFDEFKTGLLYTCSSSLHVRPLPVCHTTPMGLGLVLRFVRCDIRHTAVRRLVLSRNVCHAAVVRILVLYIRHAAIIGVVATIQVATAAISVVPGPFCNSKAVAAATMSKNRQPPTSCKDRNEQ
jgi:hypothetical protein